MSKRPRRSYSDDYKRRAVDLVFSSGRSAKSVAKELGLDGSVLSRWVADRNAADQADAIARLQRENEQLRMERDILKKSIAIFAGPRT